MLNYFLQEIREQIFKLALTIPEGVMITPEVRTSNYRGSPTTKYCSFLGYEPKATFVLSKDLEKKPQWFPRYTWIQKHDHQGPYLEQREVPSQVIDATFLRTCKQFYQEGNKFLYGCNVFHYCVRPSVYDHQLRWHHCSELIKTRFTNPGEETYDTIYCPSPAKPHMSEWDGETKEGITQIQHRRSRFMLSGWIYQTPFLRFLSTIGPRNTALIQHLAFSGTTGEHYCTDEVCVENCSDDDFIWNMRLYTPFITELCKGLRKLSLYTDGSVTFTEPDRLLVLIDAPPLIRQTISKITTLEQLTFSWVGGNGELVRPFAFAEPII